MVQHKLRSILERTPLKLIAVLLFAILAPSVLVTAVGLVAVFQADTFVRTRFEGPVQSKLGELRRRLEGVWKERLSIYADEFLDASGRVPQLRELCTIDPAVRDVLVSDAAGLHLVADLPPRELWSSETHALLEEMVRLESVDSAAALIECRRLLSLDIDEADRLEVQLAAARSCQDLGNKEGALEYLRAARERFGNTVDSTGMVREIPLLWRIFEVERDANRGARAAEAANELAAAIARHRSRIDRHQLAFYEAKLADLGEPYRPSTPLFSSSAGGRARVISETSLPALAASLPASRALLGPLGWLATHSVLQGLGELDWVSFRTDDEGLLVHILLDPDALLAEARVHASVLGLRRDTLSFARGHEPTGGVTAPLPQPLAQLSLLYEPGTDEVPAGFRGFQVLSLASFTWAVIVLVLTLCAGIFITLNSVLRERRTARMKSDFVSFISHELKTPLTAIRMFSETILSGRTSDEEEGRHCVQMIDRESERLSKLIDQILEYSKIERKQKEFRFESASMEDVVREAIRLFQGHNAREPREIELCIAQRISKIAMDSAAMVELLLNLLTNAAKYSDKGTKIIVNLSESIDGISVEVVDQGIGIRKRDQKKIFDKFYRAEDYLTREVEGTGLGLTFAKYIAKVHNGDIKVSSQFNAGSTFTLHVRKTNVLAE